MAKKPLTVAEIRTIVDLGKVKSLSDSDLLLIHEIHETLEVCTPTAEWVRKELVKRGVVDRTGE